MFTLGKKLYPAKSAFCVSVAVLLLAVGSAKILSAVWGESKAIETFDPIFGIRLRHLMMLVGFLEVAFAGAIIRFRGTKIALALIAYLGTCLLIYRAGLWWIGWRGPCNCLGSVTEALHLTPSLADLLMRLVLGYLLMGSSIFLMLKTEKPNTGSRPLATV